MKAKRAAMWDRRLTREGATVVFGSTQRPGERKQRHVVAVGLGADDLRACWLLLHDSPPALFDEAVALGVERGTQAWRVTKAQGELAQRALLNRGWALEPGRIEIRPQPQDVA